MTNLKMSRPLAALLLRDVEAGIRAAAAAGYPAAPELRHLDGLSRAEAAALMQWARGVPEIAAALRDRRHPQHREIAAMKHMIDYFAADHPAREDGSPEPWAEPISEPLLSYAAGYRDSLGADEMSPAEAAALLDYSLARGDLAAARIDRRHPLHEAVKTEIAALAERAAMPAEPAPAVPAGAAPARSEDGTMTKDEAQARVDELGRALHARGLSPIVRDKIADEMASLHRTFPGLAAFSTAGMRPEEIAAMRGEPVRFMPHLTGQDAALALTEGLAEGHFRGSQRFAARDQLATALIDASPATRAATVARSTGTDFRSARTLALNQQLKTMKGGPARTALLAEPNDSLAADQAARDAGAAASPARPALYVTAPKPPPLSGPATGPLPPRGAIPPAELRQQLAGLRGAERQAKLDEIFGTGAAQPAEAP